MALISFLGDITLIDKYIELAEKNINPFSEIGDVLKKSDIVIGNLEAVTTGDNGENLLKHPRLKTSSVTESHKRIKASRL